MSTFRERFPGRAKTLVQRLVFSAERYMEHELANHAAAGAYAFLLSATPSVLLVLGLASALLRATPSALEGVGRIIAGILGPLDAQGVASAFFSRPLGGVAAVIGGLSLVWAARLFIVTVQRGLRVIWATAGRNAPVKENVLTFALELACLVAIVAVLTASQAVRLLASHASVPLGPFASRLAGAVADLAPALALFLFIFSAYKYVPAIRPSNRVAALSAFLCLASYIAFSRALSLFVNSGRYALLYGFFGSLIVMLINVYTFFCLFYYFAELAYVEEHFDALVFGRFHRLTRITSGGGGASRLEKSLFLEPERLLRLYGHSYATGETIFEAGTLGKEAYFVHRGSVGIFSADGAAMGRIGAGEVFGEMASILDEERNATTRALEDCLLLAIPPEVFSIHLKADADANRRLVEALSERLKGANRRMRGDHSS